MFEHRDHLDRRRARSPTFVGLTEPTDGTPQRTGFADPNLRPADRRRLHRPRPARRRRDCRCRRPSTPGSPRTPTALKLAAMLLAIVVDRRRAAGAVAARPPRRPAHAPPDPDALAHRSPPSTSWWSAAFLLWYVHRRQLLRRRLHPADGPRRRPRRLHVELLPLVRQPRGPVRLVLQRARADDPGQRRQHLDPAARPDLRAGVLAAAVARGAAPARARRGRRAGRHCGRPAWCCWRRGCRSTTACAPRARSPPAR